MRIGTRLGLIAFLTILSVAIPLGCTDSDPNKPSTPNAKDPVTTTTIALIGALTPIEDLKVSQCFNPLPDKAQQAFAVMLIGCADPHTVELYAEFKYSEPEVPPAGTPYPGSLTVANKAEEQCFAAFTAFAGVTWEESKFDVQAYWPSERSWTSANDRRVLCGVYLVTGDMAKGSARGLGK